MKIKFLDGSKKEFASLVTADLRYADLSDANLSGADLRYADLSGANLSGADLRYADLSDADLSGANLRYADLSGAKLRGVRLSESDLAKIVAIRTIVGTGVLRGFKKLANGEIAELEIPADAARVGGVTGRKCRAEFAKVISGNGKSKHDSNFVYAPGQTVKPDAWDDNPLVECKPGIHFFITRSEAEAY